MNKSSRFTAIALSAYLCMNHFFFTNFVMADQDIPIVDGDILIDLPRTDGFGIDQVERINAALIPLINDGIAVFNTVLGVGLFVSFFAFVVCAFKIAKSDNVRDRADSIKNIQVVMASIACLGGVNIILRVAIMLISS